MRSRGASRSRSARARGTKKAPTGPVRVVEKEDEESENVVKKVPAPLPDKKNPLTFVIAVVISVLVLAAGYVILIRSPSSVETPCSCINDDAKPDKIAQLLKGFFTISGVHLKESDSPKERFEKLFRGKQCKAAIFERTNRFKDVFEMRTFLHNSFSSKHTCVVWVFSLKAIEGNADPLKELLETNTLLSQKVVPQGSRGLFVLKTDLSRAELKEKLPHRVVHMFYEFKS